MAAKKNVNTKRAIIFSLLVFGMAGLLSGCGVQRQGAGEENEKAAETVEMETVVETEPLVEAEDLEETQNQEAQNQDDEEIAELLYNNSIFMLMREYEAVTCVSEQWDGEDNWQSLSVRQCVNNNGYLLYDYEVSDDSGDVIYCEAGYSNIDVPGALYYWEEGGAKSMMLSLASEYEAFVSDRWLPRAEGDYERVQERNADDKNQTLTLTTRRQNDILGTFADVTYFISAETGLLTGLEETEYSSEDNTVVSVTRSNIMYNEPRIMEEQAAMRVLFPENPCHLTVIINPGDENSEEQSFQVDRLTEVEFDALEAYKLYYDYECTQPMDWIDVNQDELTVYVVTDVTRPIEE